MDNTPDQKVTDLQRTIEGEKRVVADGIIKIPLEGKDKGALTKYGIVGALKKLFRRTR
ncbi:MAG: hypothetical protein HZA15_15515 [Nitrospirae bacterium]|nr:hypothetical protein [Nitrospirota bacterium]